MKCKCKNLDARVPGYREDKYFNEFPEIKLVNDNWRAVLQCPICNQFWLVDYFDRCQYLYAYKLDSAEPLSDGEFYNFHKVFLEKSRKGYSDKKCAVSGCNNMALNELAYCANCAIKKFRIYE